MARGQSKVTKIKGVIIPSSWDEQGNITGIAVFSHDENEYLVDAKGKGPELFSHIRKEVEASGLVREEQGKKIIRIRRYTVKEGMEALPLFPDRNNGDSF